MTMMSREGDVYIDVFIRNMNALVAGYAPLFSLILPVRCIRNAKMRRKGRRKERN